MMSECHVLVRLLGAFLLMAACGGAVQGMTLEREGQTLFATGPVGDDFDKFKDALDKPGVEQVVFVNSPGGDFWTGMRVGRTIYDKGLKTVTAGYCVSACAIMFMGGKVRSFADAFRPNATFVGIHGPYSQDTKLVLPSLSPQMYAFFKMTMGDHFNASVMNTALYDMDDAGALLRVFDVVRAPKRVTHYCKAAQTQHHDCQKFPDADAMSLGVVTSAELTKVTLPPSMQAAAKVFGAALDSPLADKTAFLNNVAQQSCITDSCKALAQNYSKVSEHRAIAVAVEGTGVGVAAGKDSPNQALLAALFWCNHPKDKPVRLCSGAAVNDFDVHGAGAAAQATHAPALATLTPPVEKYYANEEYGGGFTTASAMRTDKLIDITPIEVDGVHVYATQELVMAMKSAQPPVVIDVGLSEDVLPGSLALPYGGSAYSEATKDAALEQRIQGLLKLLAPDTQKPLVLTGLSRDDWRAVNAALRARKLGYAQVGWYRGGLLSWKTANLPTSKIIVNAVAN